MLIVEVMGGLGNQLQQYALYRKLKSLGREAKLDVSWYEQEKRQENVLAPRRLELSFFENLPMELCTKEEKERLAGGRAGRETAPEAGPQNGPPLSGNGPLPPGNLFLYGLLSHRLLGLREILCGHPAATQERDRFPKTGRNAPE